MRGPRIRVTGDGIREPINHRGRGTDLNITLPIDVDVDLNGQQHITHLRYHWTIRILGRREK